MRGFYILIVCMLCCSSVYSQTVIQNGTNLVINEGTTFSTSEDLRIAETGNIENNGTVVFEGNLTNFGNMQLTGRFIAEGTDRQVINGANTYAIRSLTVNNSSGASLESSIDITRELNLENGVLFTSNSHPVVFTNDADNPVETVNGYIYGTAIMLPRRIEQNSISFLGVDLSIPESESVGDIAITRVTGEDAIMTIGESQSIAAKWNIETEEHVKDNTYMALSWLPAFDNNAELIYLGLFANTDIDSTKYISLDMTTRYPIMVNPSTAKRTYSRSGIDYINNRTFTLANKNSLKNTVPEVHITMYPNPVTDKLNLLLENFESWAQNAYIKIADPTGRVFFEHVYSIDGNVITIDGLGLLPAGMYNVYISRGQLTKVVSFLKVN